MKEDQSRKSEAKRTEEHEEEALKGFHFPDLDGGIGRTIFAKTRGEAEALATNTSKEEEKSSSNNL